jgi:hypothetical protein
MIILPDACGMGIGAVLSQKVNGKEHPLAYASRFEFYEFFSWNLRKNNVN